MEEKNRKIPNEAITRSVVELAKQTGNVYESVMIITKRANQIAATRREELRQKLEEFNSKVDTLQEVYENEEQIELSRYYETLPKSTIVATDEFLAGKLYYRHSTADSAKEK